VEDLDNQASVDNQDLVEDMVDSQDGVDNHNSADNLDGDNLNNLEEISGDLEAIDRYINP